jgi:hypothetical protein
MSSKASNEFNTRHNDRVGKIREAAVGALKELDRLRSAGPWLRKRLTLTSPASHERSSSRTDAISLFIEWLMASRDS